MHLPYTLTPFNNIIDFIESASNRRYSNIAKKILDMTGHIPIVGNVARGAGYCSYYARLSEAIGVRSFIDSGERRLIVDRAAGEGSDIHKILGLTIMYLFEDQLSRRIEECSSNAIVRLQQHNLIQERGERTIVEMLLRNFLNNLERFLNIIGSNIYNIEPIVEQNLISYALHMRGTPDLILEDRDNKMAIVVDWKTSRETPSHYEDSQIICYALIEAERLGYSVKDECISAVSGSYNNGQITDVKVLPVIIRPTTSELVRLGPHPVLRNNINDNMYQEFIKQIYDVCIEAEHLTLLKTNQRRLGYNEHETLVYIPSFQRNVNILRLTPHQLTRGNPSEQNRWPCVTQNGRPFCNMIEACRYYFGGEYGKHSDFDSAMWKLRFNVFDSMEKNLLLYKSLAEISKMYDRYELLEKLREGDSIEYYVGDDIKFRRDRLNRIKIFRRDIENPQKNILISELRIDVVEARDITNMNIGELTFVRRVRKFEIEKGISRIINEGKPVFISLFDNRNPLLSINTFGRVDNVDMINENNIDIIKYEIGIPSRLYRYSQLILIKYLERYQRYKELLDNILLIECNVDLTSMELNVIDTLQRELDNTNEISEEERRVEREYLDEIKNDFINSDGGGVRVDEENLTHILRRLIGSGVKYNSGDKP